MSQLTTTEAIRLAIGQNQTRSEQRVLQGSEGVQGIISKKELLDILNSNYSHADKDALNDLIDGLLSQKYTTTQNAVKKAKALIQGQIAQDVHLNQRDGDRSRASEFQNPLDGLLVVAAGGYHLVAGEENPLTLSFVDDWNETSKPIWGEGPSTPGQLSGLVYDSTTQKFVAVSDDRLDLSQPDWSRDNARFYELDLPIVADSQGRMTISMSRQSDFTYLTEDGQPIPFERGDAEGVVLLPGGNLAIAAEGNAAQQKIQTEQGSRDIDVVGPHIDEYTRAGEFVQTYTIPDYYAPQFAAGDDTVQVKGAMHNVGFEGLTRFENQLFAITEGGLVQDGGPATFEKGSFSRILQFSPDGGSYVPTHEFVYEVDKIPVPDSWEKVEVPTQGVNGVTDIIALDDGRFLVLERAFVKAPHFRNHIRLYVVDTTGATNTLGEETLPEDVQPVEKKLVLDFETILDHLEPNGLKGFDYGTLENYEGMALTQLPDGTPGIVFVCDNNNNEKHQRQSLLLFRINGLD